VGARVLRSLLLADVLAFSLTAVACGATDEVMATSHRPSKHEHLPAPIAGGSSAGNMAFNGRSKWVMIRWVARASGRLWRLQLRIQADGASCRLDGSTGYGSGNGGTWRATTHPVLANGRPDMGHTHSSIYLHPCSSGGSLVNVRQGVVRLPLRMNVRRGDEYATVIRNTARHARSNYTSINFLYSSHGILGANGRNDRSPTAADAYYGLDPRELVGYSRDGGRRWRLPGGQYGHPHGHNFLPTYVQQYSNGPVTGQPYYYTSGTSDSATMVFQNIRRPWQIRALGAFAADHTSGTITLFVNGTPRVSAPLSGRGMLRAAIPSLTVNPGQTVKVTATGLAINEVAADSAWATLLGMGRSDAPYYLEGGRADQAAPVYPLPACPDCGSAPKVIARGSRRARKRHHHRRRHKRKK
jgi:hypothetical protein